MCEFEFSIHLEDILPFCELEPISGNCIILYIWHLYGVLKSKKMTSVCQFIQPFGVSHVPKAPLDERTRALFQGLERVSPSELAIVPCNVGHHWILTIIDPHKEVISLLDPLSHRNRDSSWKEVVNKAITMFNAKIGRRGKKQPHWEIIKAPIQPDSVQCGFFVMRYMKEIIEELANNGSISLRSVVAQTYAQENGLFFMETSAKTAANVNEIFHEIAKRLPRLQQTPNPSGMVLVDRPAERASTASCS